MDLCDFSWQVEGYDVFSRFLPEMSQAINEASDYALQMTNKNYGNKEKDIDTALFRQSIAVYIKHIHGLRDDSFQYAHVNRNLTVK